MNGARCRTLDEAREQISARMRAARSGLADVQPAIVDPDTLRLGVQLTNGQRFDIDTDIAPIVQLVTAQC